ncbi:UDP-glucose 4-epimerase [Vibrio alginolyticus]|uniref:NAD-dependent epimerase/dehydratase family protein n=1 Tax=Vibrio TaxID=662 RepID=UPI0006CA9C9E|nr:MULTISPECIES: NAD-dependent epimerase/dehydratase family protein [Vibrio]QCO84791.1 NAD-dependent epimerase/dehydratase family protein [Vibrio neocaledonicus]EGQ8469056.1 NAD-dependent epimerase/dehydratase family protein [Vibrio alginolyticus]KPN01982.1 UDP-glucose 4-epimerase [Vibrio alginolyticus]MBS9864161.1 NAD-dependent epimerase/dehydratase family protein [Vibrio alginolyticus]MBS9887342.1 NAD-dependent epimerase/dehydratase family protein [Vibrio alginolyticus]
MKKLLLTGATGFIGGFLSLGYNNLRCVVRETETNIFDDCYRIDRIDGRTCWKKAFYDVDAVIHLAGLAHSGDFSYAEYKEVNVDGSINLAKAAASFGVKRFVFISSIGVNGTSTCENPFKYDSLPNPHNVYAQSKYDAEIGLKKIAEETGLEVVIVRPTLVYGLEAPGNFGMLTKLVSKLPFLPFGSTNNRRDFIAVQNLADLLVTCATHPDAAGHTFLASDGETVSIKQFTNAIADGLGKKVIQLPVPVSVMRLAGKLTGKSSKIEQLYGNLEVDSSNIKDVLGWTPPLTMKQAMSTLCDSGVK